MGSRRFERFDHLFVLILNYENCLYSITWCYYLLSVEGKTINIKFSRYKIEQAVRAGEQLLQVS